MPMVRSGNPVCRGHSERDLNAALIDLRTPVLASSSTGYGPAHPDRSRRVDLEQWGNRAQVRDGAAILAFLMPVFVDLRMENPKEDWGRPFYPVVE